MMEARQRRSPGQPGTKKLVRTYGDQLLFVRYRYDREKLERLTTVELVVDRSPWTPPAKKQYRDNTEQLVLVGLKFEENELRQQIKAAGGTWNAEDKTWNLPYSKAVELGLENRILKQETP
jgi:hypothetical protein